MKITNTGSATRSFNLNGTRYQLSPSETVLLNDIYVSEMEKICEVMTDLVLDLGTPTEGDPITAHEAASNPHSQYALSSGISSAITAHEAAANPHSQYLKKGSKIIFCIDNGDYPNLQSAIDVASSGDVILVGPKASSWGDIELKAGVSIVGLQPPRGRDVVVGRISFSPSSGTLSENLVSVCNLRTEQQSGKNSLFIGGSAGYRVRFDGMWFFRNEVIQEDVILIQNNTSGSACYIDNSVIGVNSANTTYGSLLKTNCPYIKVNNCDMPGGNLPIHVEAGLLECLRTKVEANTSNKLMQIDAGATVIFGSGLLRNLASNANGVDLNGTLSFGGSSVFDIGVGTGYCIYGNGVYLHDNSATFANINIINPRNVKVKNTLTIAQYASSPSVVA